MDEKTMLEGKEILALLWMQDYFDLCLNDDLSLDISNCRGFWRLSQNETIIASSADFYAKSFTNFPEPDYWPAGIADVRDEMDDDTFDEDEYLDRMYERLEESADRKVKKMMELLEYASISEVQTTQLGDLTLTFSNGTTLEIIADYPVSDRITAPYTLRVD